MIILWTSNTTSSKYQYVLKDKPIKQNIDQFYIAVSSFLDLQQMPPSKEGSTFQQIIYEQAFKSTTVGPISTGRLLYLDQCCHFLYD